MALKKFACERCSKIFNNEKDANQCYLTHLETPQQIADVLHEILCLNNHTDGCDYHFGSWEKSGHARSKWLKKAGIVSTFSRQHGIGVKEAVGLITDVVVGRETD